MTALLRLMDESPGAAPVEVGTLRLASDRVTLREVIRRRLEGGKENSVAGNSLSFRGNSNLRRKERILNGTRKTGTSIDERHALICKDIEGRKLIVLLDGQQVSDLDAEFMVSGQNTLTFLKLVPLAGG